MFHETYDIILRWCSFIYLAELTWYVVLFFLTPTPEIYVKHVNHAFTTSRQLITDVFWLNLLLPELDYATLYSLYHYDDVIMDTIASQITSLTIVYSALYLGADQSKHQSSASLAFVWRIHRGPVNSPHKWPVTRKMSSFDDVIMITRSLTMGDMYPDSNIG